MDYRRRSQYPQTTEDQDNQRRLADRAHDVNNRRLTYASLMQRIARLQALGANAPFFAAMPDINERSSPADIAKADSVLSRMETKHQNTTKAAQPAQAPAAQPQQTAAPQAAKPAPPAAAPAPAKPSVQTFNAADIRPGVNQSGEMLPAKKQAGTGFRSGWFPFGSSPTPAYDVGGGIRGTGTAQAALAAGEPPPKPSPNDPYQPTPYAVQAPTPAGGTAPPPQQFNAPAGGTAPAAPAATTPPQSTDRMLEIMKGRYGPTTRREGDFFRTDRQSESGTRGLDVAPTFQDRAGLMHEGWSSMTPVQRATALRAAPRMGPDTGEYRRDPGPKEPQYGQQPVTMVDPKAARSAAMGDNVGPGRREITGGMYQTPGTVASARNVTPTGRQPAAPAQPTQAPAGTVQDLFTNTMSPSADALVSNRISTPNPTAVNVANAVTNNPGDPSKPTGVPQTPVGVTQTGVKPWLGMTPPTAAPTSAALNTIAAPANMRTVSENRPSAPFGRDVTEDILRGGKRALTKAFTGWGEPSR